MMDTRDMLDFVSETAVVDFDGREVSWDSMPTQVMYALDHIHIDGKCFKNRHGLPCS